jgi:hypothetical protein
MPEESRCPTCDQPLPGAGGAGGLPASLVAASRLDDASLILLAFAYLTGLLALATGVVPLFAGTFALEWKILSTIGGVLAGAVLFVTLKYASEGMRALADVARTAARVEERLQAATSRQVAKPPEVPAQGEAP